MKIKIHNTLSKKKEFIRPLKKGKITIFVCGPTVYDFSHIGHARIYLFFDFFVKYMRHLGVKVFYLQNITDIDDRIILRAKERGVPAKDLAKAFEKEYFKDMKILGINSVDKYARATDYIPEIINQVERLMKKGFAYRLIDGIYFDISRFKRYGMLSNRTVVQAEDSVSRIDYAKDKKNRGDFCLWKYSVNGEPSWNSPFGKGRPGWHIEDTAITEKFFGAQYDIHGGGIDLMFPHHEAEIAQMESISGKHPLARHWMHVGFLTTNGQKMSKSLNNYVTIGNFLKGHSVYQMRFWIAKHLWRNPIDHSESSIGETKSALDKIEEFIRRMRYQSSDTDEKRTHKKVVAMTQKLRKDFYRHLADDFNTPKAFASIFDFVRETNKIADNEPIGKKASEEVLRFFKEVNAIFEIIDFKKIKKSDIPKDVLDLANIREYYRKKSDWQKADEIRLQIEQRGFFVEDTAQGPVLKKSNLVGPTNF